MLTTFRFGSNEKHIREALTAAFKRRGVDLAEFDASIRSIMVAAAFSTGVEEQVEAFTRLARVAEQFDLPDDLRRELAVKSLSLLWREPSFCREHHRNERCWFTTPFQAVGSSPAPAGVSKRPPPSRLNERRSARTSLSCVELPFGRQYSSQLFEALHLERASSPPLCPLLPSPIQRAIT